MIAISTLFVKLVGLPCLGVVEFVGILFEIKSFVGINFDGLSSSCVEKSRVVGEKIFR